MDDVFFFFPDEDVRFNFSSLNFQDEILSPDIYARKGRLAFPEEDGKGQDAKVKKMRRYFIALAQMTKSKKIKTITILASFLLLTRPTSSLGFYLNASGPPYWA